MNERDEIFQKCMLLGTGTNTKGFLKVNQHKASANYITRILENKEQINELCVMLWNSQLRQIQRTNSGGIAKHNIHHASGAYDIQVIHTQRNIFKGIIITVLLYNTIFVFHCGMFSVNNKRINGLTAFRKFTTLCKQYNIDLTKYRITNGEEIKATIPKSFIYFERDYKLKNILHVNHIDLNHAWSAGFINSYPEFIPIMEELNREDKVLSSMVLGVCQSQYVKYEYSHFAKAGIEWCNNKILEISKELSDNHFKVIGCNTDGIWYIDELNQSRIFHNSEEGTQTGQWKTDHVDCELCAYSDGQYWFKENGKFNVKARGFYAYEQIKSREEWNEYDFDKAMSNQTFIYFKKGVGFEVYVK